MKTSILKNGDTVAEQIAAEIEAVITAKPDALICLCAGHSPVPIMKKLAADAKDGKYPSDRFKFVSLDEWVGLGKQNAGSCIYDISKYFFDPMNITPGERMFFFDGLSKDLEGECKKAEDFITKNGGIDVILLGIGMNGHIGFNEPPAKETDGIRVVKLSETSKRVSTKYFDQSYILEQGITLGIPQIMGARKVIVMAVGEHKKDIVHCALKGGKTQDCPITLLRDHSNIEMYLDEDAAQRIV